MLGKAVKLGLPTFLVNLAYCYQFILNLTEGGGGGGGQIYAKIL